MRETVKIVSLDKRYRKEPYPCIPVWNERIGTYITGQHIDPSKHETKENLTLSEMTGEKPLSDIKLKKFPYVIIPENYVYIQHLRTFDVSKDENGDYIYPKDVAELELFKLQDFVAKNKASYQVNVHYFYIENLQEEASLKVNKRNLRFEAEKKIRENANIGRYQELAILLNYKIQDFRIVIKNLTDLMIQEKLFDACDKYPEAVLSCFTEEANEDLFILKALHNDIISRKGKSFYDGSQFLGDTTEEVKKYLRTEDGGRYKQRWVRQINDIYSSNTYNTSNELNNKTFKSLLNEMGKFISIGPLEKATEKYEQAITLNPNSDELLSLKMALDKAYEQRNIGKPYSEMSEKYLKSLCTQKGIDKSLSSNAQKDKLIELLETFDNISK